ncbi:MAG TPA: hypothetical protein VH417_01100 [Vicinamibacterales bacterium]|jgi:hypothetical protein
MATMASPARLPRLTLFSAMILAAAAAAGAQTANPPPKAQTPAANAQPKFDTFTATTASLSPGSGEPIKINVFKWANDEDRGKLLATLGEKGDKALGEAVASAPSVGYVWTSESLGYPIRYAAMMMLPNGGERVIVLTDRRLGTWSGAAWKAANDANDYPYTLIELRLSRSGSGEGKMSLAGKVGADQTAKTVALENYESAPVLLKSAKREGARGATN